MLQTKCLLLELKDSTVCAKVMSYLLQMWMPYVACKRRGKPKFGSVSNMIKEIFLTIRAMRNFGGQRLFNLHSSASTSSPGSLTLTAPVEKLWEHYHAEQSNTSAKGVVLNTVALCSTHLCSLLWTQQSSCSYEAFESQCRHDGTSTQEALWIFQVEKRKLLKG